MNDLANAISALGEGKATSDQQIQAASLIRKMLTDLNNLSAAYQEIVSTVECGGEPTVRFMTDDEIRANFDAAGALLRGEHTSIK